jgi:two-component system OmpR family response regulator
MTDKARRILVVDDSEVMLGRIKRALVEAGYEVIATDQVVGNGRHMKTCDLAIIDFHMPGLTGDAVTSSLRSATSQREKPCALYLYTTDQAAIKNHAGLGFDGYFTDKGDEAALVRQVQAAFRLLNIRAISQRKLLVG